MKKELKGVMALVPTPLTEDRKIDKEDIRSEIDFVMKNGCSSAGVLVGIGEGYLMSHQDWTTVAKTAIDHMNMNEFTYRAPVPDGSTNVFW